MSETMVVGIGNRLYCDDGVGCAVVKRLCEKIKTSGYTFLSVKRTSGTFCRVFIRAGLFLWTLCALAANPAAFITIFQESRFDAHCFTCFTIGCFLKLPHTCQKSSDRFCLVQQSFSRYYRIA